MLQLIDFPRWRELRGIPVSKSARPCATIGEVAAAYLDPSVKVVRNVMYARRNVADLRRVIAWGEDAWTISRFPVRGVPVGTVVPDVEAIDSMPLSILTNRLVRSYFLARQGGKILDISSRTVDNRSINSTLRHARDVFSRRALAYKLSEMELPNLSGFLHEPMLPQADSEPDPLTGQQWETMLLAQTALGPCELSLVNLVLRTTGMRSKEVCNLHRTWLVKDGPLWCIDIRDRPELGFFQKGIKPRRVPLRDDIAQELLHEDRQEYLIAPDRTRTVRENLVNKTHNVWLKDMIGGRGEKTQGNHRLRDTVCSSLWSLYGPSAAQEAAGHVDPKTTSKHYAKRFLYVPDSMRRELSAWAPLFDGSIRYAV